MYSDISVVAVAQSQAELLQQQVGQEVLEIKLVAVIQSVHTAVKPATDGPASSWSELAPAAATGDGVGIILGC